MPDPVPEPLPQPVVRDHVLRDVAFRDGSTLAELRLRCTTLGDPSRPAVLLLHETCGSAASLLAPGFAGALFGPGQPLDARRHYLVLPDAIGAGGSSKPSDGVRAGFPRYTYDDMVDAQHRLVTEVLGIRRLRLILGNSMGGMHAWLWATRYPGLADAVVPLACLPAPMAGRNWMLRRLLIDAIRDDPGWQGGAYTEQPPGFRQARLWFGLATSGGSLALHARAPTRAAADAWLDERRGEVSGDANDTLFQYEA
ncbi:MAG TPA: alpha/beta fold hydrolase, partial [Amaricoccus sp.]|nr:alpha/beta fold hydrolase [Amaricoccus sp.]